MFEAILLICLATPINEWTGDVKTGATCVYMPTGLQSFQTVQQCEFWLKQGKAEVQSREHFEAVKNKLPTAKNAKWKIKGKCQKQVFDEWFICQDCGT